MDFLSDYVYEPIQEIQEKKIKTDQCECGQIMRTLKENGVKKYICDHCGRYINTYETYENCVETSSLETIKPVYGNKSGETYVKKIKEDLMNDLNKITRIYSITEEQILRIIKKFLIVRSEKIPRAKPRIGLICACVYNETKIPTEKLSEIFQIKHKHITEGIKTISREINPFNKVTISASVEEALMLIKTTLPEILPEVEKVKNILVEIISLSIALYIGVNTTMRTKCGGILHYLIQAKKIPIKTTDVVLGLKLSKSTIDKFYDQLLIYLHAKARIDLKYQIPFAARREQLLAYFKHRNIEIIALQKKHKKSDYMF